MDDLRILLDEAASTPARRSAVDLDLAVRTGERMIRRRRLGWIMGAAAGVVLGVAAVAVSGLPNGLPQPAISRGTTPPETPVFFQPDEKQASFGWLPAEPAERVVQTHRDWHRQWITNGSWQVELRMVPSGKDIELNGNDELFSVAPEQIDRTKLERADVALGREASWNTARRGPRGAALRWKYTPTAWVEVAVGNADSPEEMARHIATTLQIGPQKVKLPIRMTQTPSAPEGFDLTESRDKWLATLWYQDSVRVLVSSVKQSMTIGSGDPQTTVDGKEASRTESTLIVLEPSGAEVFVYRPGRDTIEMYRWLRIER
ncbi:hypothetical protein Lesp02_84580 [Lentzea sp. NBRC 105346]|uniref:hypothetical protein n=1 Tax=Lentzea sp. NBRC 105346 TaxID=3032205 RepID=UPI0024A164D3|nr:hypothetical protein [Lentzea sp. NBRC 105346]GLZ36271.1 hypothetical protein Lesp02_84580 [Lentzea sp. NBRC 105346]